MKCGVELAATEFAPSYRRATIMQATLAAVGLFSSIAAWLAGRRSGGSLAGSCSAAVIPFTLDRDPADQQAIDESHAGQAVSTNRAATRPLGQIACREERAERRGALPVCVPLGFREVSMRL